MDQDCKRSLGADADVTSEYWVEGSLYKILFSISHFSALVKDGLDIFIPNDNKTPHF